MSKPKYQAQEKDWVRRILARLTPEQRERYEKACATEVWLRHRNGRLYDTDRARIAERILYVDYMEGEQDGN